MTKCVNLYDESMYNSYCHQKEHTKKKINSREQWSMLNAVIYSAVGRSLVLGDALIIPCNPFVMCGLILTNEFQSLIHSFPPHSFKRLFLILNPNIFPLILGNVSILYGHLLNHKVVH